MIVISSIMLILLLVMVLFYWQAKKPTKYRCKLYDSNNNYLGTCMYNSLGRNNLYDTLKSKYWTHAVETENGFIDKSMISRVKIDQNAPT